MPEDDVEHIRGNLLPGVGKLVESFVNFFWNYVILHRDWHFDKDVVLGLSFDVERQLLDAEIHPPGNLIEPGEFEIDSGSANAKKLAHALDNSRLGCPDLKESAQQRAQQESASHGIDDQHQTV